LQRGLVDWEPLALALGDQAGSGMRLCSLLVSRGLLDFDEASRLLGEVHHSAAALRRHLEGRDESLADLLPDDIAKQLVALPIGRLANGTLIICVREPSAALQAKLTRIVREEVVLAIAPALYLERIVEAAYAPRELDSSELEEELQEVPQVVEDFDIPIDVEELPKPKKKQRALSVVIPTLAVTSERDALDATLASFREIDDAEWLFDVAMKYISTHWTSSLLLVVREQRAIGIRGHGARISPNLVKTLAVDIADLGDAAAPGSEYEVTTKALGVMHPVVTPLRGSHILLLGDPIGKDRDDALVDLGLLVESMNDALARM
ncbi:MAG TPA: hypothetical protein VMZ53_02305, partial [Kofleriaceae bacterium]|nr:hypothetical protein [Kofleriaceae bacterium]